MQNELNFSIKSDTLALDFIGLETELLALILKKKNELNIGMRALADLSGMSLGKLQYHLSGGAGSSLLQLLIIAKALNITFEISVNLKSNIGEADYAK